MRPRYLEHLEKHIQASPNAIVAPLVANISLPPGTKFEEKDLPYYKYEMLGGNHSRVIFQKKLKDPKNRLFKNFLEKPAVVFGNLTDDEALLVGCSHNVSGEIRLATKFRDNIEVARRIFILTTNQESVFLKLPLPQRCFVWSLG